MWTLYMLRCADGSLYTGITTNLNRRIEEHNSESSITKFTRGRRPVQCVFSQIFSDRSSASKAELKMKKMTKTKKEELIIGQ
jgi:putative endonuclease